MLRCSFGVVLLCSSVDCDNTEGSDLVSEGELAVVEEEALEELHQAGPVGLEGGQEGGVPAEGEVQPGDLSLLEARDFLEQVEGVEDALGLEKEDDEHHNAVAAEVVAPTRSAEVVATGEELHEHHQPPGPGVRVGTEPHVGGVHHAHPARRVEVALDAGDSVLHPHDRNLGVDDGLGAAEALGPVPVEEVGHPPGAHLVPPLLGPGVEVLVPGAVPEVDVQVQVTAEEAQAAASRENCQILNCRIYNGICDYFNRV